MNERPKSLTLSAIGALTVAVVCVGCAANQVAQKTRTTDDYAAAVLKSVNELSEFDEESLKEATEHRQQLSILIDALDAAITTRNLRMLVQVHDGLCALEVNAQHAVERATARRKAEKRAKELAEALKIASADAAAAAEALAAQVGAMVSIFGGIGIPVGQGNPPSRGHPVVGGDDHSGEAITAVSTAVLAVTAVVGGRKLMNRNAGKPPHPAPYSPTNGNGNGNHKPAVAIPVTPMQEKFDESRSAPFGST